MKQTDKQKRRKKNDEVLSARIILHRQATQDNCALNKLKSTEQQTPQEVKATEDNLITVCLQLLESLLALQLQSFAGGENGFNQQKKKLILE